MEPDGKTGARIAQSEQMDSKGAGSEVEFSIYLPSSFPEQPGS